MHLGPGSGCESYRMRLRQTDATRCPQLASGLFRHGPKPAGQDAPPAWNRAIECQFERTLNGYCSWQLSCLPMAAGPQRLRACRLEHAVADVGVKPILSQYRASTFAWFSRSTLMRPSGKHETRIPLHGQPNAACDCPKPGGRQHRPRVQIVYADSFHCNIAFESTPLIGFSDSPVASGRQRERFP